MSKSTLKIVDVNKVVKLMGRDTAYRWLGAHKILSFFKNPIAHRLLRSNRVVETAEGKVTVGQYVMAKLLFHRDYEVVKKAEAEDAADFLIKGAVKEEANDTWRSTREKGRREEELFASS